METKKQLSIKGLFMPAIALCSLLVVAGPTEAFPVTFSFTGSVSEVTGVLFPAIGSGSISGTSHSSQLFSRLFRELGSICTPQLQD